MLAEFEGAPNVMHVSTSGDDGAGNGTSWLTAYRTIAKALAPNGTPLSNITILVAPGVYSENITISGSNISLIGAGPGTRIESEVMNVGVVRADGDNIRIEDMEIINTKESQSTQNFYAIFSANVAAFPERLVVRRCIGHGDAAFYPLLVLNVSCFECIFSGFENAAILGQLAISNTSPRAQFTTLSANTIFRIARNFNKDSPSIHLLRGVFTAANCNIVAIAQANPLQGFRYAGITSATGQSVVFGCAISAALTPGLTSGGSTFYGVELFDMSRLVATACTIRAAGGTNDIVNSIFKESSSAALIKDFMNLTIPKYTPSP